MVKKKSYKNRPTAGLLCVLGIWVLFMGCQTRVYVTEATSEQVRFKRILVLPFKNVAKIFGDRVDTRCPVCGRIYITGEVADSAASFLTDQTIALLKRHTDYQLVYKQLTEDSSAALYSTNQTTAAAKKALADKGRENHTDVVLVGFVYRFKERVGKGYGAESPASAAFDVHLIRVADSRTIWSAHFDETQKSLGDNLFRLGSFISRGGRWVTVEELATSGLEEIFEKFSKLDPPEAENHNKIKPRRTQRRN